MQVHKTVVDHIHDTGSTMSRGHEGTEPEQAGRGTSSWSWGFWSLRATAFLERLPGVSQNQLGGWGGGGHPPHPQPSPNQGLLPQGCPFLPNVLLKEEILTGWSP